MDDRRIAHCDALLLLERVQNDAATLVYFDPPIWVSSDEADLDKLRSLYLHAACHARRVLRDEGVLTWHTTPETASDVRRCLDRVLGQEFFSTEIVLKRRPHPRMTRTPMPEHTSLIVYSKSGEFCYHAPTGPLSESKRRLYSKTDSAGAYKLVDLTTSMNRPTLQFTWRDHVPPAGRSWRYPAERMEELYATGQIVVSDRGLPYEKVYLSEDAQEELDSVWTDIDLPPAERLPGAPAGQQSLALMTRVISTFTRPEDLIVDPFCGSGTTLLAAERTGRKWLGADCSRSACTLALARLQDARGTDVKLLEDEHIRALPVQCGLIDLLRALPSVRDPGPTEIHQLIISSESKTLEFKQTLSVDIRTGQKEKHIELACLKTIAAFLNSDGGTLLVGVTDDGKPVGVDDEIYRLHKESADVFLLNFKNLIRRDIGEAFYPLLDYGLVCVDSKRILRVDCKPSDQPCFIGDDFYVRTNPATDKLTGAKVLEYVNRRFRNFGIEGPGKQRSEK